MSDLLVVEGVVEVRDLITEALPLLVALVARLEVDVAVDQAMDGVPLEGGGELLILRFPGAPFWPGGVTLHCEVTESIPT